jgi:hypothetical protein
VNLATASPLVYVQRSGGWLAHVADESAIPSAPITGTALSKRRGFTAWILVVTIASS